MNLKDFKKTHEDDEKAILTNKKGHSFTIAKKALSDKHRAALKELPLHAADGAQVPSGVGPVASGDQYAKEVQDPNNIVDPVARTQAIKSQVQAEGGSDDAPAWKQFIDNLSGTSTAQTQSQTSGIGPYANPDLYASSLAAEKGRNNVAVNEKPKGTGRKNASTTQQPSLGVTATGDESTDAALASGNAAASQQQQQPNQQMAQPQQQQMTPEQAKAQYAGKLVGEAQKTAQDLATGQIKPETYQDLMAQKSTIGKITTLFGMLLSGAGSGLTHQPNAVMAMMDKEIANDLESQKQNKANAMTLLQLNYQHQLQKAQAANLNAETYQKQIQGAASFHAASQLGLVTDQILQNGLNTWPEGPQRQQGQAVLDMKKQHTWQGINQNALQTADLSAMGTPSGGAPGAIPGQIPQRTPQTMSDPKVEAEFANENNKLAQMSEATGNPAYLANAQRNEAHHLTGYRQPTNREVDHEDRQALEKLDFLSQLYDQASDNVKNHWFAAMPLTNYKSKAKGLEKTMGETIGQLSGTNRYTAGLAKRHDEMIPDLTGTHFTGEDAGKIEELQTLVAQRRAAIMSSYGIGPGTAAPLMADSQRVAAEAWLKQNPKHPKADEVRRKLNQ